jgi:protein-tyrosine-phosphatase
MEFILTDQLSSLSHPQRMEVFRLLMRRYPDAVPAGQIVAALHLKPSTASVYLAQLTQVGLISQQRDGTRLLYAVRLDVAHGMVASLFDDCCRGRPDLCPATELAPRHAPLNVLFVCTGNSARSIMAEAILRDMGQGRFASFSAGTQHRANAHPRALEVLTSNGHDITNLNSKNVSKFRGDDAPRMDFAFTVCDLAANEDCPTFPNQPIASHWGLPDPAKVTGTDVQIRQAFQDTYAYLHRKIAAFTSLPFDQLDRAGLQSGVDAIGRHIVRQDKLT